MLNDLCLDIVSALSGILLDFDSTSDEIFLSITVFLRL